MAPGPNFYHALTITCFYWQSQDTVCCCYYTKMRKMINMAQPIETKIYSIIRFFKEERNDPSHNTRVFHLNEALCFVSWETHTKNILLGDAI